MDIDKFLDKEMQAEKADSGKQNTPNQTDTDKKEPEQKSDSKDILSLEKNYFELWNRISKNNLLWDNSLYSSAENVGDHITNMISQFSLKIGSQRDMMKNLIANANKELEKNNHEAALGIYSKIISIRETIPDTFVEEKKEFNDSIFRLYEKIHKQTDARFTSYCKNSIEKVDALINDSLLNIKEKDTDSAKNFYREALEIFKKLPHGFLKQKLESGNKLLYLYRKLSIHMQIENLENQLGDEKSERQNESDSAGHLEKLSKVANQYKMMGPGAAEQDKIQENYPDIGSSESLIESKNKNLLTEFIDKKLGQASSKLEKGLYNDAKKDIESVLKLYPENEKAKNMMAKIP